jgi:transposase-like protein
VICLSFIWRKQAAARGTQLSDAKQPVENWSVESKLSIIIETSALSELEIGEYCRRKGIFPEQMTDWRNAFIANSTKQSSVKHVNACQSRDDKNRIRELERELRRKDAALALLYCEKSSMPTGGATTRTTDLVARTVFTRWLAQ